MVGSIHPFSPSHMDLPHLPLYELVWIVWDRYRGGKRWGDPELVDHCPVCFHISEWAIDLLWQKWNHGSFIPFGIFVHNLINIDMYNFHMGKVSTEKMKTLGFFCYSISPSSNSNSYVDENFTYRIKNFNM